MTNPFVTWTEAEYGTGVVVLDKEHQILFALVNRLYEERQNHGDEEGTPTSVLRITAILSQLKDYTKYHFDHEERLFEVTSYPRRASHIDAHQKFCTKMSEAELAFVQTHRFPDEVFLFLVDWLGTHIKTMDREYSLYLGPSQDIGLSGVFFHSLHWVITQKVSEKVWLDVVSKTSASSSSSSLTPAISPSLPTSLSTPSLAQNTLKSFEPQKRYPETLFFQLVEKFSRLLKTPETTLLNDVGFHFVRRSSQGYLSMLGTRFVDAVRRLNHLHAMVKSSSAHTQMCPPSFRIADKPVVSLDEEDRTASGTQRLHIFYKPARESRAQMVHLALGTLRALGDICQIENPKFTLVTTVPNADHEYEITVEWDGDDDDTDLDASTTKTEKRLISTPSPESLYTLFPFHFVVRKDNHLRQMGTSLRKLLPAVSKRTDLSNYLAISSPTSCSGPIVVSQILLHLNEVCFLFLFIIVLLLFSFFFPFVFIRYTHFFFFTQYTYFFFNSLLFHFLIDICTLFFFT